jgi:poly(hydroxyalkanoate) depolymerase family esterase
MTRFPFYLLILRGAVGMPLAGCAPPDHFGDVEQAATTGLVQVMGYGDDYDHINMWKYVPADMPANAPLVLALHPCGFTPQLNDYASKIGWNALADKYKFYVVYPEQIAANNAAYCFNWAGDHTDSNNMNQPTNLIRGMGENQEMINMVKRMEADYSIDPSRVFINGFSGGAAQTALMLAVWPDVFAAGATMEGLPYHCTLNKNEVSNPCMSPGKNLTAQQWGDLVRMALPAGYSGPWPRLQIWQGSSDTFVGVDNVNELVKQWTNVRGIPATPTSDKINGNDHSVYRDAQGNVVIESYIVNGMGHGVALDPTKGCGTSDGSFYFDKGICSTKVVAEFFGLQNPPNPMPGGIDAGLGGDGGGNGGSGSDGGGSGGGGSGGQDGGSGPPTPGCHGCATTGGGAADASGVAIWLVVALIARRRRSTL